MNSKLLASALGAALLLGAASSADAAPIVLTFEGIGNVTPVGNYYNGGGGPNYGVSFSPDTLALVDLDAGGSGNIANEPSGQTVMVFLNSNSAILNYAAGFDTGFSFFYSSAFAATVNVYDGLDGTGNLLTSLNLNAQNSVGCAGDPNGTYCNWTAVGANFAGIAKSINFGGTANFVVYDDITFGSATPGGVVPEPATWAMMIVGFGAVGTMARTARRRNALVA